MKHPILTTCAVGLLVVVALGYDKTGPTLRPDGTVDAQATATESFDAGRAEAGKTVGRGIDSAGRGIADMAGDAVMESDLIKGGLVIGGAVVGGRAIIKNLPSKPHPTGWCEDATTGGLVPCAPTTSTTVEPGNVIHGDEPELVEMPDLEDMDLGPLDEMPAFDLGPVPTFVLD